MWTCTFHPLLCYSKKISQCFPTCICWAIFDKLQNISTSRKEIHCTLKTTTTEKVMQIQNIHWYMVLQWLLGPVQSKRECHQFLYNLSKSENLPHRLQLFLQLGFIYAGFRWHSPLLAQSPQNRFLSAQSVNEKKQNNNRALFSPNQLAWFSDTNGRSRTVWSWEASFCLILHWESVRFVERVTILFLPVPSVQIVEN